MDKKSMIKDIAEYLYNHGSAREIIELLEYLYSNFMTDDEIKETYNNMI